MDWVKLATGYYLDPAVMSLSGDAEIMFARSLAYSGGAETGGFIPAAALSVLGRRSHRRSAEELVACGLWVTSPTGYQIAKWDQHQVDLEDVKRRREADRERQRKTRLSRRDTERTSGVTHGGRPADVTDPEVEVEVEVEHNHHRKTTSARADK